MDYVDCELCGNPEEIMDMHMIDEMIICGYCIPKVEMLMEFLLRGGTKDVLNTRIDGQMVMNL